MWKFTSFNSGCFLEFMFGIFSCLSLELLLLRHWTLWIHASIFLPFFLLFCIFWFIIFNVNMFDPSNPIECYKYLLLYYNFLFIFFLMKSLKYSEYCFKEPKIDKEPLKAFNLMLGSSVQ